ncbi:MAG: class I SAM-dependent methyltransferase [bacterium]|nr:MAG: class I SAM-dependent methyltransferase [bacterium]
MRDYWNDIEAEKSKPYYIEKVSDPKLIGFLRHESNLERCFLDGLDFAKKLGNGIGGNVLDVGAGVAWTSALMSRISSVQKVIAIDYSTHRLLNIAPLVFEQLQGDRSKFDIVVDDFLRFECEENQFDVIIFCQALYMFKDLDKVMYKIRKLLKQSAVLIVACERITKTYSIFSPKYYLRNLRYLISSRADDSGNNFYDDVEYKTAINNCGLKYCFQLLDYPLHPGGSLMAGNHFGVK